MCWLGDGKDIRPVKVGCWFVDVDDLTGALHILELKLSSSTLSSLAAIKTRMETFRVVQSHKPNTSPSPNPMPIRFGQMTLRTSELSPGFCPWTTSLGDFRPPDLRSLCKNFWAPSWPQTLVACSGAAATGPDCCAEYEPTHVLKSIFSGYRRAPVRNTVPIFSTAGSHANAVKTVTKRIKILRRRCIVIIHHRTERNSHFIMLPSA